MWAWDDVDVQDIRRRAGLVEDGRSVADIEYDETRDMRNPLFKATPAELQDHFDRSEALDKAIITQVLGHPPESGPDWVRGIQLARDKFGEAIIVPISSLRSSEPKVEGEHVKGLMQGTVTRTSSDLPIVYRMLNGDWIVDGNHRIVAKHLKGEKRAGIILLDLRQLEAELFS